MEKEQERKIAKRIVKVVASKLIPFGFKQTKPTFVCRKYTFLVAFFHFHKFTFGPYFRIHFGIRVLNDDFDSPALNGPMFKVAGEYGENEPSIKECITKMIKICTNDGLPWFETWTDINRLVNDSDSPLRGPIKASLQAHINGHQDFHRISASLKMLGLKPKD
jgi:hypothetical protein